MTVTFRNDATAFTAPFLTADDTGRVETYHLLDAYPRVDAIFVARYVRDAFARNPDVKLSAIAAHIKTSVKLYGLDVLTTLTGDTEPAHDNAARALPGVWSRAKPGCINIVCLPITRGLFAASIAFVADPKIGRVADPANVPQTLAGLLSATRHAITTLGLASLETILDDDDFDAPRYLAIVDRIAPPLAPAVPTADVIADSADDTETADDTTTTRTVAQLRDALRAANIEFPRRAKLVELAALAAAAGV